ncbi:MAG TPA: hypothetical protein VNN55_00825 [bacterium]|nr:hypothetical protein [bacterium]
MPKNSPRAGVHSLEDLHNFNEEFIPSKDIEYRWIYEHALKCHSIAREAQTNVWSKADRAAGYAVAVISILAAAMTQLPDHNTSHLILVLWIGMALAAVSGALALRAQTPRKRPALPDIIDIDRIAKAYGPDYASNEVMGKVAAAISESAHARAEDTHSTGAAVRRAYWLLYAAAIWVLLAFPLAWSLK